MAIFFEATSADEAWRKAATALLFERQTVVAESRLGNTYELLHCVLSISNPRSRWVLSRTPPINPAFAIAESFWILSGRQDTRLVNYWNPALPRFSGQGDTYHGAYGHRLRKHFQLDQIERAYEALRHNPKSRQVLLQLWDPDIDLPDQNGRPVAPDIPCNVMSILKIRDGRMEWMQVMRSNDIFRGTPYNIVQFTLLQEIMAAWLDVQVGSYVLVADSLHLYETDTDAMAIAEDTMENSESESLALPKDRFDSVLCEVMASLDALANPDLTPASVLPLCKNPKVPPAYLNLLSICAADSARRRGWHAEEALLANNCTDRTLRFAYARWTTRMSENAAR